MCGFIKMFSFAVKVCSNWLYNTNISVVYCSPLSLDKDLHQFMQKVEFIGREALIQDLLRVLLLFISMLSALCAESRLLRHPGSRRRSDTFYSFFFTKLTMEYISLKVSGVYPGIALQTFAQHSVVLINRGCRCK